MSNKFISFYYDPVRQGYDTESWSTVDGTLPAVVNGGYLQLTISTLSHYGDILRGDFTFCMNIPYAPTQDDTVVFGLMQMNKGNCLTFNIGTRTFTANSSDGNGNTNSITIPWQTAWTATDTQFRIKWEAGTARFFVGGAEQAVISDISVSGDPMSLYLLNDSLDTLNLKYIEAKGIQSYFQNTPLVGSQTFGRFVLKLDGLTVTELITLNIDKWFPSTISDAPRVTELVTITTPA